MCKGKYRIIRTKSGWFKVQSKKSFLGFITIWEDDWEDCASLAFAREKLRKIKKKNESRMEVIDYAD